MKWLRSFFTFSDAWSTNDVKKRLRPLRFRVASEQDYAFCEHLHEANLPHGIPKGHIKFYAEALRSGEQLTLVVEDNGVSVATCGIQWQEEGFSWLCYGLVDPQRHRCGIGTAMLLARMSLLPTGQPDQRIGLATVESSLSFYKRFGFRFVGRFDYPDGNRYPVSVMESVSSALIEDCRMLLQDSQIVVPMAEIPFGSRPNKAPEPTPGAVTPRAIEGGSI